MERKRHIKYKLDRVFTTNVLIEVNEDVDKDDVDNLIFPFMDECELEHLDWEPHYSQNSISSEEIDFEEEEEKSFSKEKGNLYTVSSTDDDSLEIIPK